jgi:oligopeptide transport system substrate-binding protein
MTVLGRRCRRAVAVALIAPLLTGCLQVARDLPTHVAAAPATARTGGTLTVAIATPTSIDPTLVSPSDPAGSLVVRTMCDSLFATGTHSGDVQSDLASSVLVTQDATSFIITLRRGLRFSDGSRVTSADVVASLNRLARPQVASPNASMLSAVRGYDADQQGADKAHGKLAAVTAVDPRTVEIGLTTPNGEFARTLATAAGIVIPRRFETDNGFGRFSTDPVCVGPYRLAKPWRPGDPTLMLVRTASYDGGNASETRAGKGWVDRIVFRIYPDAASAYHAFVTGLADVAQVPGSSQSAAVAQLGAASVATAPDPTLLYVGLPTTVPPFDSADVRRGLWQALDRSALLTAVYHGGRTAAGGLFPPAVGSAIFRPDACRAPSNLAAARSALRGMTVPFYFDDEFANRALVTAIAAQWHQAIGLTLRLTPMDFADYVQKAAAAPGLVGPFRLSYASPSASAYDYVHDLLLASSIDVTNDTRFVDQTLEKLVAKHAATTASATTGQQWQRVEDEFCAQLPLLPIGWNNQVWAWRSSRLGLGTGNLLDRATALPLLREVFRSP